jgi:two-component system C4-dicarboxylate transport sensor histidine kinase DctB
VEVSVDLPADLPIVTGGVIEIEQVLVNLLLNARDALDSRPVRRVEIRAAQHGDTVELTLADTGPGIPANVLSKIFDPFFTTKPAGKGTGLGLAISQKTMQAIGGTIAVRTDSDGTAFTLVFRALQEPEQG